MTTREAKLTVFGIALIVAVDVFFRALDVALGIVF